MNNVQNEETAGLNSRLLLSPFLLFLQRTLLLGDATLTKPTFRFSRWNTDTNANPFSKEIKAKLRKN